jgi:hypothetical protein
MADGNLAQWLDEHRAEFQAKIDAADAWAKGEFPHYLTTCNSQPTDDGFLAYLAVRRAADPELKKALRGWVDLSRDLQDACRQPAGLPAGRDPRVTATARARLSRPQAGCRMTDEPDGFAAWAPSVKPLAVAHHWMRQPQSRPARQPAPARIGSGREPTSA